MFLQQETKLTQLQSAKVKVSRAQSKDMDSPEDLWLTVLNTIVMQVLTVLHLTQVKYSKVKKCQDRWDMLK